MSRLRLLPLACALALGGFSFQAFAADVTLPRTVSAGACVEGICEYTLANGMRVLLFPDATKPMVTVNMTYNVGSVHENYGQTGMAHLLEHLVFKGTPTHADIPGEMRKRGISFNGSTTVDRTNYFAGFTPDDATLDWILGMEADRMVNSFISRKDLDSEMTVVRNELEMGQNAPGNVFFQRLNASAFHWHNYGKTTIGNRSDVENVPIERLQAFYRTWYQPDNATLVVAGQFDSSKVLARVQDTFGRIKRPTRALPQLYTLEPVQDGEREINVRRAGDMHIVGLQYHMPAATHADNAPLQVLANILSHSPGGRLHKALVEPKLASYVHVEAGTRHGPSGFTVLAVPPDAQTLPKSEAALLAQVERIAATPITATEMEQAKRRIANSLEQSFNDVSAVGVIMSEAIAAGDWRLLFIQRDEIAAVTLDDVNRVAAKYLIPSNRTLGRFLPTTDAVRADTGGARSVASLVDGYTGRAAVDAGEAFDTSPANIAARTEIVTLGDGLQASLLPKKTRGGRVVVGARFQFNDIDAVARHPVPAAGMVAAMLMHGSTTVSREAVSERLEALNAQLEMSGDFQSAGFSIDAPRENLPAVLELAADLLRNPAFPQASFEEIKLAQRTAIESRRQDPNSVTGQAMLKHFDRWPAGHPHAFRTLDRQLADLDALTLAQVRAFHRQYGTSYGQIGVVGDFDAATVKPLLTRLFTGWKAPAAYVPVATPFRDYAAQAERFQLADKPNANYLAMLAIPLKDTDPDYEALLVANHVLGGGMKSRLSDRIRQRDGLSYGVSSSVQADRSRDNRDDSGWFTIRGIAATQNMDRMMAAVREELDLMLREGITREELEDARNSLLSQRELERANDHALVAHLNSDQRLARTMQARAASDAKMRALTVDEVNAAVRRFIKPAEMSTYTAGDFANAPK